MFGEAEGGLAKNPAEAAIFMLVSPGIELAFPNMDEQIPNVPRSSVVEETSQMSEEGRSL